MIVMFTIFINLFTSAQSTVNYTFNNSTTASLTDMSGSVDLLVPTSVTGDFSSALTPIGFDFWLMGNRYINFSVNSNGLLRLGNSPVSTQYINTAANSATDGPCLYPFWDDLNSFTTSSTSRIRYKVTGIAPNRILTVEWKDFILVYNSSSGTSLSTFQARLYETTGVFEYVYGRMQISTGSGTVSASIGMTYLNSNNNLIYLSNITTPAVLRTSAGFVNNLVNSNTAGNIAALNSLTDGSRVQYRFTSVLPTAAPTGLTITGITESAMTLNWIDNASNERGYVIYRSDDGGITYNFVSQTVPNATTSVQGGLLPSTMYYWRVYAVTEGALSASLNGNASTTACIGIPVTNTMTFPAAGGTLNWNTASNWSLGHVPTACEDVVINWSKLTTGAATAILNQNVSATVRSLTINTTHSNNNNKVFQHQTNGNALTVLNNLSISCTGGSAANAASLVAATGSVVRVNGNTLIGLSGNTKETYIGGTAGELPTFYFRGDVIFNGNGSTSYRGNYYFDGGVTQQMTNNSSSTYANVFENVYVGNFVPTNLTVNGTVGYYTGVGGGNLNISAGSVLDLTSSGAFNQYTAGGNFNLMGNAVLKLGANTYGAGANNFPNNFSSINLDLNSTVEYYATSNQQIYDVPVYGNLTCTNNSVKYINDYLIIAGNLLVNPTAKFGCDYATYLFGNCVNNGTIEGIFSNSEFAFYGLNPQTYSGSGIFGTVSTPFDYWGITVYNPTTVTMNAPAFVERINLLEGQVINANQLTIGSATFGLIQRGGVAAVNAGGLDNYPSLNPTAPLYLRYDDALSNIGSGYEIPASTNTYQVNSDNPTGVTLNSNLTIANDLQLVEGIFNLQANTLNIGNTITKSAGIINGLNGTLRMQGSSAQNIPASIFVNNDLYNLSIANTFATTPQVTLAGNLNLYGSLAFGNVNAKTFNTGNFLTLRSTATGTASVADLTNAGANSSNRILGNVTVERFINYVGNWNLIAAPVNTNQSVYNSWQNAGTALTGYGTRITGPVAGPFPNAQGIDNYSVGYSLKTWNEAGVGSWNNTSNTITTNVNNPRGFYLYARGDRSVIPPAIGTATTLQSTGPLYMGYSGSTSEPAPVNFGAIPAGSFASVANPFASAIGFGKVFANANTTRIKQSYYVWDPYPAGTYGVGRYQNYYYHTLSGTWLTTPTVNAGSPYDGLSNYSEIQSGQAVFVESNGGGTVQVAFDENDKVNGSRLMTRDPQNPQDLVMMSTMLHSGDGGIVDGNRVLYSTDFSNGFANEDASKISNTGTNFGIVSNARQLMVEGRKPIINTDTIHYNMSGLLNQQYRLSFEPLNLGSTGLYAELIDGFLNTRTPVSLTDSSWYSFETTSNSASKAANRFMLVFRAPAGPLPVTFVSIAALRQADRSIKVNWEVANEVNIEKYEVERSADGRNFAGILSNDATNSRQYTKNDLSPLADDNFYRIKAIGLAGDITYSNIVKVVAEKSPALIVVSPNPVKGKQLNIRFIKQPAGEYTLQLTNNLGQEVYKGNVTVNSAAMVKTISLHPSTAGGSYSLVVINKKGERVSTELVMVE